LLGWIVLGEAVSRRSLGALALLLLSACLLGMGAKEASQSMATSLGTDFSPLVVAMAVAVPCVAGLIYATLSTSIRHCVTNTTRLSAVVFMITGMGVVSLGPLSLYRLGIDRLLGTPPEHFLWMAGAGGCNLVAFFALSKALQLTTVVYVNMMNASQVALAAIAGMMIFGEQPNPWLVVGIALTITGILLTSRPADAQIVEQPV
jgi:drug/metabolite transporter, DME family